MRPWLQALQRGVKYRVTRGGFLFTLAVVLISAAAIASANNLLFLVVATMLSVLLMSGLVSRLGLAGLELDFALPEHVSASRAVAATLAVRNIKLWMPSFSIYVEGVADEPSDSARYVDWKATGHSGDLQVRDFARDQERAVEIYLDRDIGAGAEPWFEEAVDCCAFLAWRLQQQGAEIRFQTQDFQVRVPEEGDVYTILRYLALVYPLQGKAPEPPIDEQSFQIVFSADPSALDAAGWTPNRLLRPAHPVLAGDHPHPHPPAC